MTIYGNFGQIYNKKKLKSIFLQKNLRISKIIYNFAAQNVCNDKINTKTMARPIAETPILFGKDAERFLYNMQHVEPLPRERQEKIKEAYEWMRSIATFPM